MRVLTVILFFFSCTFLTAKSWYFDSINISAIVTADGSMIVHEARTYHFKGSFRWVDYTLPLYPNQTVSDFKIYEDGSPYSLNDSEEPGSFEMTHDSDQFYAKWYYKAKNENRTFNLEYTISNVVVVYDDIAELYWKFIGEANPEYVESVTIEIELPQKAVFDPVRAWAHGPLWGDVAFKNGKVLLTVNQLPDEQFVEARIIFPKAWVAECSNIKLSFQESLILEEERAFSFEANEKRKQALVDEEQQNIDDQKAYDISIPLLFILIVIFLFNYWKFGRGFIINYTQKEDANIPGDMHPVLLNCIYFNNTVTGSTLSTTLFYLAQKEIFQIEVDTENPKKWYDNSVPVIIKLDRKKWHEKKEGLKDFENDLITFLFNTISEGRDFVTSREMKKASAKMQKWFKSWTKIVKEHLAGRTYFDKESIKGSILNASICFLFLITGIIIMVTLGKNGTLLVAPAAFLLVLSMSILRFTAETKLLKKKLQAFRTYLKRFQPSSFEQSNLKYISDYFLFAVAFALGKKVIGNIVDVTPAGQHSVFFPWYIGSTGPSDFASTINSIVTATGTSISSASGAGGGMSGGGGAGGGGASGGAG